MSCFRAGFLKARQMDPCRSLPPAQVFKSTQPSMSYTAEMGSVTVQRGTAEGRVAVAVLLQHRETGSERQFLLSHSAACGLVALLNAALAQNPATCSNGASET